MYSSQKYFSIIYWYLTTNYKDLVILSYVCECFVCMYIYA